MKTVLKKYSIKAIKICSIVVLSLLALLLVFPLFFKDTLQSQAKILIQKNIEGKVEFEDVSVSFFTNFPALTVAINKAQIYSNQKFNHNKFIEANKLGVGVNVLSLFSNAIIFDEIYLDQANLNVVVDSLGNANYDIFKPTAEVENEDDSESYFNLKIKKIKIAQTNVTYKDYQSAMFFTVNNFNYTGKGNLDTNVFELDSKIKLASLNFSMDGVEYLKDKSIRANIITTVDANQLKFIFNKNEIVINKFPFAFNGSFAFIKNGYDLNLNLKSQHSSLAELLSLIPATYKQWLDDTKIKGEITFNTSVNGIYSATQKPKVNAFLQIDKASIANKRFEKPIQNLKMLATAQLNQLDINTLVLDLKYFDFELNKQKTHLELQSKGLQDIWVNSKLNSQLNLSDFKHALGIDLFDLQGNVAINFAANGTYKKTPIRNGAVLDTIISSIPVFDLKLNLANGYFKHAKLPQAINGIQLNAHLFAKDSLLQNASFLVDNIEAKALSNYIKGKVKIDNFVNYQMDTDLESKINLAEIAQFYPIDSVEIKGNLDMKLLAKGEFDVDKKLFPATNSTLVVKNGYIKSLAFPELPIQDIQVETRLTSPQGKFTDLRIEVLPIHFKVAGAPFRIDANLYNLSDLSYNINSKGTLNIGDIYKIFKIDGLNVAGVLKTDLSLKGITSDATSGKYDKLQNKGSLEVQNIAVLTQLFPKYFYINKGKFTFFKDKMRFNEFTAQYGESTLNMNGHLDNVLHYVMANQRQIKGDFKLSSDYIDADELMAFNPEPETSETNANTDTGVILVPKNLNVLFNANVKQIKFNDLKLNNFKGTLITKKEQVNIPNATFVLAGANVNLNATYAPLNINSAKFSTKITANNFDIQKAYAEIKMIQDMISMAKDAFGTMSLNYTLSGRLNSNMDVVYPSIVGAGTLTVENIKFKNFKLLNTVASKADAESIKTADFSKIDIKTTIAKNVLNIEKTKFKMAGFRGRLQGQTTLDGKMNIGFRLGLPPLGIIGIPMKITGTSDNFKVSTGRYKENQDLEEDDTQE